jgi:hypothetical protein
MQVDPNHEERAVCLLSAMWEFKLGFNPLHSLEETQFVWHRDADQHEDSSGSEKSKLQRWQVVPSGAGLTEIEKALEFLIRKGFANENFEPLFHQKTQPAMLMRMA